MSDAFKKWDRVEIKSTANTTQNFRGMVGTVKGERRGLYYVQLDDKPDLEYPFQTHEMKRIQRHEIRGTMVLLTVHLDIPLYEFVSGMFPEYEYTFMLVSELPIQDEIDEAFEYDSPAELTIEQVNEMFNDVKLAVKQSNANAVRFI